MRIIITILTLVLIGGCNPVRKVLKNKEHFDAIGKAWAKQNPCANDTVTVSVKADTVIIVTEKMDTIINELPDVYNADTLVKWKERVVTKWHNSTNYIHDTTTKFIVDNRMVKAANDELTNKTIAISAEEKKSAIRLWMLIASILVNLLLLILLIRKR